MVAVAIAAIAAGIATGILALADSTQAAPDVFIKANIARNISINEKATLRLVGRPGHILNERGTMSGTYGGSIETRLVTVTNTTGEATITVYTHGGSLKAKATTRARAEKEEGAIGHFHGSASVIGGTGTWAHASGNLTFNGTVDRQTFNATAEMRGTLHV